MRITNIIFCILIFNSCGIQEGNEKSNLSSKDNVNADTTSIDVNCIQRDTITKMGTKIHYINRNGKFQISWGDNTYNRVYDSLFTCDFDTSTGLWNFVPKLFSETKNNLIFTNILSTSSGGNPAPLEYNAIILPKNKKDSIFNKDFFINCYGVYLIYGDFEYENIHLINIETKKNQTFKLKPKPAISRSPTLTIQKTEIREKKLYINYESLNKKDEIIIVENTFLIEI